MFHCGIAIIKCLANDSVRCHGTLPTELISAVSAAESEAARRRVKMGSHATDGGPPVLVDAQRQTHYQLRSPGWKMTQIGG